jgi:Tol biopolymer transport system component
MKKKVLSVLVLVMAFAMDVALADFTFGTPVEVPNVNRSTMDGGPAVSVDGLTLIFGSDWPDGGGQGDLWVTTRATVEDDWAEPVKLDHAINSPADEGSPSLSADGRSLFFSSFVGTPRPGGHGQCDIWVITRATTSDPWGQPENLAPPVNTPKHELTPFIWNDGKTLLFSSDRAGGVGTWDLWMTTREDTADDEWGTPVPLENVNHSGPDLFPTLSPDGRILLFQRGYGGSTDLWMATRKSMDEPFGPPKKAPAPVNIPNSDDCNPHFSADGCTLYFASNRSAQSAASSDYDLWQVPIVPIVDFTGDGIVDCSDVCIMVAYWGTDDPLCDIGPTPLGDGVVDVQDLLVLAEHIGADTNDTE